MAKIAVVGAVNADIGGFSERPLIARDSNPGKVRLTAGGVGRNIACNLAAMGQTVEFVTVLGDDAFGDMLKGDLHARGVSTRYAISPGGRRSSVYLYIADADGDMSVAVNDMELHACLTPEAVAPAVEALNACDAVVLEANLPQETLEYLAREVRVPLVADAVSAAKVNKLRGILGRLAAFKPNRIEAALLTGLPVETREEVCAAAQVLVNMGVERLFLTLGADGVCCADKDGCRIIPIAKFETVNATGAGDSFTAAVTYGLVHGYSSEACARAGVRVSALTVASSETVSEELNEDILKEN